MEKKAFETRFTLPPNVNGRCRGRLSLCLHEIKWHNEEPFQFNWIQAKHIWWGDKFHSGATIKLKNKKSQKKSFGHVIHYNILTKLSLFKSYLLSSESVEVKFSSGISNIEIGKANIPIPVELIEFIDKQLIRSTQTIGKFRKKCQIFNVQNKLMGEVLADYEMLLYDRVFSEAEMVNDIFPSICTEVNNGIENNMNQFNLDLDLISSKVKKSHKKKSKPKSSINEQHDAVNSHEKIPISSSKRLSSKSSRSSTLLSYLTGRPLGAQEENAAVKAMESTSPTESLIDLLSFDLNGLYLPKKTNNTEVNMLKKIDCLRVHLFDLCLTRAGIREILSKNAPAETSFSSGTFTVDVDLDTIIATKSPFEKTMSFTSQVTRIFSSSIETIPPCIEFNQFSIHKLNTFCIKSRNSFVNGIISLDIRYRDIESSVSQSLGRARFQLADVIQATNLTWQQQCPVRITTTDIIIGRLSVRAELGCRGLHFGADFLEAISLNSIEMVKPHEYYNRSLSNEYNMHHPSYTECLDSHRSHEYCTHEYKMENSIYETSVYDIHDEQTEDKSDNQSTPLNMQTNSSTAPKMNGNNLENIDNEMSNKDLVHRLSKADELVDDAGTELKGLFHIGQINYCSWYQSNADTFLVCRPFWSDSALVTENCQHKTEEENYQLNYLELFSVICDKNLFESTKHGFMSIEIWQRDENQTDTLVGSAKVPLHQFFIAFNNNSIRNHVSKQELPVISIDGWVTVAYAASPNSTPVGTVQTILAVGTAKQINNLKKSKCLVSCNSFLKLPLELFPVQTNHSPANQVPVDGVPNKIETVTKSPLSTSMSERQSNLASMFSSFIDNLASRLPDRSLPSTEILTNDATTQTNNTTITTTTTTTNNNGVKTNFNAGKYMRPTSELLDELQKALAIAPTPAQKNAIPHSAIPIRDQIIKIDPNIDSNATNASMFRVHIEIDSALHLPSIAVHVNKKSGKRNRNSVNAAKKTGSTTELQPSTYVTFEAAASAVPGTLTSYTTNIVENSCSPQWNKHFEVHLPVEYLHNDEKRFVIRVWRKISDNTPKTRLIPNSSNDVTIGFASVDLSVLMAGLPSISGWFNIIEHSGCINGQIKIHIKPKDDLVNFPKRAQPEVSSLASDCALAGQSKSSMEQLSLNLTPNENRAIDDSALSRALKRKFTELEEITQRLRARLFDVTGNMAIDPDDQFENDLNTIPDEDDDDFEESNIASEMSLDWLEHCHNQAASNESIDCNESMMATQMRDIFDFLTPDIGGNSSTLTNEEMVKQIEGNELLQNRFGNRFSVVSNDGTEAVEEVEHSVENIAESLQKSLIND